MTNYINVRLYIFCEILFSPNLALKWPYVTVKIPCNHASVGL